MRIAKYVAVFMFYYVDYTAKLSLTHFLSAATCSLIGQPSGFTLYPQCFATPRGFVVAGGRPRPQPLTSDLGEYCSFTCVSHCML